MATAQPESVSSEPIGEASSAKPEVAIEERVRHVMMVEICQEIMEAEHPMTLEILAKHGADIVPVQARLKRAAEARPIVPAEQEQGRDHRCYPPEPRGDSLLQRLLAITTEQVVRQPHTIEEERYPCRRRAGERQPGCQVTDLAAD